MLPDPHEAKHPPQPTEKHAIPPIEYLGPEEEIPRWRWVSTWLTQNHGLRKKEKWKSKILHPSKLGKQLTNIIVTKTFDICLQFTKRNLDTYLTLDLEPKTHLGNASIERFNRIGLSNSPEHFKAKAETYRKNLGNPTKNTLFIVLPSHRA